MRTAPVRGEAGEHKVRPYAIRGFVCGWGGHKGRPPIHTTCGVCGPPGGHRGAKPAKGRLYNNEPLQFN